MSVTNDGFDAARARNHIDEVRACHCTVGHPKFLPVHSIVRTEIEFVRTPMINYSCIQLCRCPVLHQ